MVELENMKPKFKIGDKVKIINKSYFASLKSSIVYKNGLKRGIWFITYVEGITKSEEWIYIVSVKLENDGDYFLERDLLPYVSLLEDRLFDI